MIRSVTSPKGTPVRYRDDSLKVVGDFEQIESILHRITVCIKKRSRTGKAMLVYFTLCDELISRRLF